MKNDRVSEKTLGRPDGLAGQIILSAVAILLGAVLLFVPTVQTKTLCVLLCIVLILSGAISIFRFFRTGAYEKLNDYRFSVGVLLVILGVCGLFRTAEMTEHLEMYMGVASLVLGIVILQSTVQMKALDNKLWILQLVFSIVALVGAVLVLANATAVLSKLPTLPYWTLLISGCLSLISLLLSWLGIRRYERKGDNAVTE